MLESLTVKNFAIIDNISIDFKEGFTAITGETGAGKSLLIDAIGLLLGDRASTSMVRNGCTKAIIEGVFTNIGTKTLEILEELGLNDDLEEDLIIKKEININGKSTVRINGFTISNSELERIAETLADIHTQNDTKKLFDPKNYLNFIDDKDSRVILKEYQESRNQFIQKHQEFEKISQNINEFQKEVDYLKYQLEVLQQADLKDNELETAAILMDPNTGGVKALVGGKDYNKSEYNRAISAKRQVGSTMKPFLYYAALENGFTASTTFTSEQTTFTFSNKDTYSPKNYNEKYGNKPISMATAISYSENIYAVKTHLFLGEDTLINMARRVGITSKLDKVPSLALGTSEISMLEMAGGYATFANEGYKIKPHFIEKVVDQEGNILYEADNKKELVLNSSLTFILSNLLTATYDSAFIDYNYPTAINLASKMTHTYALKSGTTNTDNWYIGYNKDVVALVWCGYDDNRDLEPKEYKYAQNIWIKSIEDYMQGKEDNWYKPKDNVVGVLVNPITGKPATENDTKTKMMYYIKGTEPTMTDPVFDELLTDNKET